MEEPALPILEIHGVTKRLGDADVLKGINFKVGAGSVFAIIGASGSGKTTLLRCLNMLIQPDSGDIIWQGREVGWTTRGGKRRRQTERELLRYRLDVGMVFQSFNLFPHMTALQNVMEAPVMVQKRSRAEVAAEAQALLTKVHLSHRAHAFPHQMSGGEQQRVAIARALAMKPRALLFDEVTSALDPELKGEVLAVMRQLASEGMTMICVSHEMGFVKQVADHVLFMHKGVVREEGNPKLILGSPQTAELRTFLQRVTD